MGQYHAIALDNTDSIYCWGRNGNGECAVDINKETNVLTPTKVEYALTDVRIKEIKAGSYHTGCITVDHDYYLWGSNDFNECCNEVDTDYGIFEPNNVTRYVFEKSECTEILDMILATNSTLLVKSVMIIINHYFKGSNYRNNYQFHQ